MSSQQNNSIGCSPPPSLIPIKPQGWGPFDNVKYGFHHIKKPFDPIRKWLVSATKFMPQWACLVRTVIVIICRIHSWVTMSLNHSLALVNTQWEWIYRYLYYILAFCSLGIYQGIDSWIDVVVWSLHFVRNLHTDFPQWLE